MQKIQKIYAENHAENHAENINRKLFPDPFLILVNNPKQPLHVRNYFENKIF